MGYALRFAYFCGIAIAFFFATFLQMFAIGRWVIPVLVIYGALRAWYYWNKAESDPKVI